MIFTSENNWYSWQYGDNLPLGRKDYNKQFKTIFSKAKEPIGSFSEELKKAARSTVDHFPGLRPSILYSGGVDSEIIMRAFIDIGADPNVYIFKYENDINIADVSMAKNVCEYLNIKYKIIDFNLRHFFENDAERVSEQAEVDYPTALPQLKFLELVDGVPILGGGDLRWHRPHGNYNIKALWESACYEFENGWSKYIRFNNLNAVGEWLKWTPGLVISYTKLKWFNDLINDKIIGKYGVVSTKGIGYQEVYPDLILRKKLNGFETILPLIKDFEFFLNKKNKGLHFRSRFIRTLAEVYEEIL